MIGLQGQVVRRLDRPVQQASFLDLNRFVEEVEFGQHDGLVRVGGDLVGIEGRQAFSAAEEDPPIRTLPGRLGGIEGR